MQNVFLFYWELIRIIILPWIGNHSQQIYNLFAKFITVNKLKLKSKNFGSFVFEKKKIYMKSVKNMCISTEKTNFFPIISKMYITISYLALSLWLFKVIPVGLYSISLEPAAYYQDAQNVTLDWAWFATFSY